MDLKSSSLKAAGLSPSDCLSDPDEKEISDDDDDDRNHKHRRRETRSQSLERDSLEQTLAQPYRKRNRTYENGQSDPQSHYNLDRDFSKFEKRRPPGVNFSRFSGDHGFGRGRGRDFQRDSRFGSVDGVSQMAHPGPIQSAMFTGRGLPNVSNSQSAPWNGFGLLPAIPNGAIDAINPLGLPGMLRPQLNPSLNMSIQRQRCRDFEERGFCLRGDMCPMEHGVNRIVVEDVQSLSQFNLPVSLSSGHALGTSAGSGFMPSIGVSSGSLMNSRGLHSRTSKSAVGDESLTVAANSSGADVYDPDQPLWNNDCHETSLGLQPPSFEESEPFMDADLADRVFRSSGAAIGSQSTSSSVWGRLNNSKNKLEVKEKFDSRTKPPSEYPESKSKEIREASSCSQGNSLLGKQKNEGPFFGKVAGLTSKLQNDAGTNVRKPSQKAQRTLFVNCIPLKDNKKENLFSHFRKFGEVIDIYIPANSERAFVQFSKREEAERALKAPDAVMGSRFIKLWWANRDSIAEEGSNNGSSVVTPQGVPATSGSPHVAVVNKGKDNVHNAAATVVVPKPLDSLVTSGNDFKPIAVNSPKAPSPGQKKMESLGHLKEELRKKQEMLEQKRNEFRRQLDKLAKQAPGVKGEVSPRQAVKKHKVEISTDVAKAVSTESAGAKSSEPVLQAELSTDKIVNMENLASQKSISSSAEAMQDPPTLKQIVRPTATSATPFPMNRYKLDNRPTTFRVNAPLPIALANIAALKDHFSLYGAVSKVEIEDSGEDESLEGQNNSEALKNCSARVSFATRHSAERAFLNGKSWQGFNLQFSWVTVSIPSSSRSSGESSSALRGTLTAEVQSEDKTKHDNNSHSALDQKGCNLSPCKSSNDISDDSSRFNGKTHIPVAAVERNSIIEAHSPDKSANYIPLEADEPENRDSEVQEEEDSVFDDMKVEEDLIASPKLLAEERLA